MGLNATLTKSSSSPSSSMTFPTKPDTRHLIALLKFVQSLADSWVVYCAVPLAAAAFVGLPNSRKIVVDPPSKNKASALGKTSGLTIALRLTEHDRGFQHRWQEQPFIVDHTTPFPPTFVLVVSTLHKSVQLVRKTRVEAPYDVLTPLVDLVPNLSVGQVAQFRTAWEVQGWLDGRYVELRRWVFIV